MLNRIHRRACISGLIAASVANRLARSAEPAGAVESTRGECYAQSAAARRALVSASQVFVGDDVGTGPRSALGMRLGTATEVRLGEQARLRIDRFLVNAGGVLELERGALLYDHNATGEADQVTVRSPFGLMAVRGTRFFAGPSNGVFGVFVERGAVMVVGRQTAVLVTGGLGTNIAQPGAEPSDPAAWTPARITSALASVQP